MGVFTNPPETYCRDYNIIKDATEQLADYLSMTEGIPYADAYDYVREVTARGGEFEIKNPTVTYLERQENGDREQKQRGLLEHIYQSIDDELIIAPNFTMYLPPKVLKSKPATYIVGNMKARSVDKKLMFLHKQRGEIVKMLEHKSRQEFQKVKNNSKSGMLSSPSTPWFVKSGHSTLTSMCRCATSYANAANEKILGGLRHYFNPLVTYSSILVAARYNDPSIIAKAIKEFDLVVPTPEQCLEVVLKSSRLYWHNQYHEGQILDLLKGLNDVQRASFAFGGDLFTLDKYNRHVTSALFKDLGKMVEGVHPDPKVQIDSLDDNFKAISSLLCASLISGMDLNDTAEQRPEAYNAVALTSQHMQMQCERYHSLIYGLLRTDYLPVSIYEFPDSIRMSVPTSDTDSTIFTTQHFVDIHGGDVPFSDQANSIQYITTFLIAGLTANTLMNYTSNLGVAKEHVTQIKMKNEYIFPVYALTSLVKHYFTLITAGEGNVYSEENQELQIKGVNLRSSNAPEYVNDAAIEYMRFIIDSVMENRELYMRDIVEPVLKIEESILADLRKGGSEFLTRCNVKDPMSYSKREEAAPYRSYLLWENVFAAKYGPAPQPPYRAAKVKMNLPNQKAIDNFLKTIKDTQIRESLRNFLAAEERTDVSSFIFPLANLNATGIPVEVIPEINVRAIVYEVMSPFYIVLESLGVFMVNKRMSRLLSDEYSLADFEQLEAA